jgi:pimeloyl-ACP methyl ester carboxylesterase
MESIASADGTRIAWWRSGEGPPLLLIHGATADHTTTWRYVRADLERRFTLHAMDRRGRGGSGDAAEYALAREAEDVAAVVDAIHAEVGAEVNVLGHSYGGLCALEAARLTSNMRRLVLYEGVYLRGADSCDPRVLDRLEALLAAGDVEGMLVAMFRELVEMPPDEFEVVRANREAWAVRIANAPTLPRELRATVEYDFDAGRFTEMRTPTVLLVGEESPPREMESAIGVADGLPDGRVVVLPGQQHAAMYAAPDLFVEVVTRSLAG